MSVCRTKFISHTSMVKITLVLGSLLFIPIYSHSKILIDRVFSGTLHNEEELFVRAFCKGYVDIPVSVLKIANVPLRARFVFNVERTDLHDPNKNIFFLTAYVNDTLAGLITFQAYGSDSVCYIRALAVDPSYMRQGIGKMLVFAVAEYLPNVKEIVLATRACNYGARAFYERLGFNEYEEVPYSWDPELFVGLKYRY